MTIKAILFDMDGVLIDARDWHYDALNKALSHFGYLISRDSHLSTFDGLPTKDKLQILSKSKNLPFGLHSHINKLKQKYTIVIVTHSMQQAARVSNRTAYMHMGELIESGLTKTIFSNPEHIKTQDYITGRIG